MDTIKTIRHIKEKNIKNRICSLADVTMRMRAAVMTTPVMPTRVVKAIFSPVLYERGGECM